MNQKAVATATKVRILKSVGSRAVKTTLLGFTSLVAMNAVFTSSPAHAKSTAVSKAKVSIKISEQSMEAALKTFAKQVGKQIVFYSNDAKNMRAGPINGVYTERQALQKILGNSGLEYVYLNQRTIGISRKGRSGLFQTAALSASAAQQTDVQTDRSTSIGNGPAQDTSDESIIVVTGRALDAQLSTEAKRNSKQIVDVLTADQANQLPDNNVAESLSRIPGVSVVRSGETGNGNFISIRGLDSALANVQFNGINSGTANGGNRSVPLDGITADDIAEIRVSKSLLPQDEGVGVGGAVNVIARTPLNGGKDRLRFNGSLRFSEFADKAGFDFGGAFTKIFSDSFGISFSASYRRRFIRNFEIDASSSNIGFIDNITNAAGQPVSAAELVALGLDDDQDDYDNIPTGLISADQIVFESQGYQVQEQRRDTLSFSGSIDWRPSDTTLITLGGRLNERRTDAVEYNIAFDQDDDGFQLIGNQLVGVFDDAELDFNAQLEDQYDFNGNVFLKGVTETDKFKFTYLASFARAVESGPQTDINFSTASEFDDANDNISFQPFTFTNSFFPVPNPSILNNPAFANALQNIPDNVELVGFENDLTRRQVNNRYTGLADFSYKFDKDILGGVLNNIAIGVKYERSDIREDAVELADDDDAINLDGTANIALDNTSADGEFLSAFPGLAGGFTSLQPIGSPLTPIGVNTIPNLNNRAFRNLVRTFQDSFIAQGGTPNEIDFFDGREETYAGYLQFDFEAPRFQFIGGVRVEYYRGQFTTPITFDADLSLNPNDPNGSGQTINLGLPGTLTAGTASSSNTEILPRFAANYDLTDNFKARLGGGYSLARPTFSQLGNAANIDIFLTAEDPNGTLILPGVTDAAGAVAAGGVNINQLTDANLFISTGNANLDNARSLNLDLSFEYYPFRGTAVTLGLFYKRIKNFIFIGSESSTSTLDADFVESFLSSEGQSLIDQLGGIDGILSQNINGDVNLRQPTNGDTAKLKGIEFGITHQLDWAPGFLRNVGMNGNITYTDSEADFTVAESLLATDAAVVLGFANAGDPLVRTTTFFRAPEFSGNASIFYDDGDLDIALSASYQSESFNFTDDFGLDQFTAADTQVDLFIGYDIPLPGRGKVKAFFEVSDLLDGGTNATDLQSVGRSRTLFDEASFNGREFRFGFRGRF